jgi:hypothetical protein
VKFKGEEYAAFQCIPKIVGEGEIMTEEDNFEHLRAELEALTLADYYLGKFKQDAEAKRITLPRKFKFHPIF